MASAAPPKRMVSSVFITLASPHQATVIPKREQPQLALQAHSAPAREKQHPAARISPGDSMPALRYKREDRSPSSESYGTPNSKGLIHAGSSALVSDPQSRNAPKPEPAKTTHQKENDRRSSPELFPLPPPPPPPPPPPSPPSDAPPLRPGELLSEESVLPPPPPAQESFPHPVTPGQQPVYSPVVKARTPSSGFSPDDQIHGIHQNSQDKESKDLCGFCRKPVAPSEPAIEALNRTYHAGCFQCRSCHIPLAGKQYYNKAGIPLCEDCYQASLELCWACGEAITDHIIRALERAYHLSCFTCTTCKKQIGEQAFAQGDVGEVYCLQDYYRKYAPKCSACNQLIIPKEDGTDSYTVECLGRSYHENCYRCEVCVIQLSPEPNEHGCYPLDGKMLCKSCHLNLTSGQH